MPVHHLRRRRDGDEHERGGGVDLEHSNGCFSSRRGGKNVTRGVVALVFRCHPEGGTEQLSDESTAVDWLTPGEVEERMGEVFAVRVLDALRSDAAPSIRTHDGRQLLGGRAAG
ncbi:DNA mismatch repair protein MutT [Kitasatospora sp. NPDC015120]|uniref:DNA mismatch repair protein MutT n=1 Tax=Kitasatospora sp. NPDC015120 TaxID=3364023 RepID=UPI0036F45927